MSSMCAWVSSSIIVLALTEFGNALGDAEDLVPKAVGRKLFNNGPCSLNQFRCLNDVCIDKSRYCNSKNDCGDNSDEAYCSLDRCPIKPSHYFCNGDTSEHTTREFTTPSYSRHQWNSYTTSTRTPYPTLRFYSHSRLKCIPDEWQCDGVRDCPNGRDEKDCKRDGTGLNRRAIQLAKQAAINWTLENRQNDLLTNKWGPDVARMAVALYLSNDTFFSECTNFCSEGHILKNEISYELSLRVLSRMALRKLKEIPTTELASYVHALLVTCNDPRKFYMVNLVKELRMRLDSINRTNPFVTLALCNAGEKITEEDVKKLVDTFWLAQEKQWIDIQALAVLAIACASAQNPPYKSEIKSLTSKLKEKQYRNGTVENLKTTALVMQALFASEREPDEDNFDEEKALRQILQYQQPDGSFGNMINTYYVLPVLHGKSLVNISTSHCKKAPKDEKEGIEALLNQVGTKWSIKYSLWIGDDKNLGTTLSMKLPANISFYRVMEFAADIDPRYKFDYNVRNGKPFIYSLWNKQDDPEQNMFWVPYAITSGEKVEPTFKSPSDVIPKDKQHLVFWYRSECLPPMTPT